MCAAKTDIRSRNWCFTIFDYDSTLIDHLTNGLSGVKHCVFQEETCPSTGKKHLQGHVIWNLQKSMSACKKALKSPTCHLEVMRGTPAQSKEYCTKSDTHVDGDVRVEVGECPVGQGHRSDLEEMKERIKSGELTYATVADEYFAQFLQYRNGIREFCDQQHGKPRDFKSDVSVYYGRSGTGKSKRAFDENSDVYVLRRGNNGTVWFDGYNYNTTVIIDDFYGWIPFSMFLNLLDRYAMKVDVKGGAMEFNSAKIVITSNKSPLEWYPNLSVDHQIALLRRLDSVMYFNHSGVTDVTDALRTHEKELESRVKDVDDDYLYRLAKETDGMNRMNSEMQTVTTSVTRLPDDILHSNDVDGTASSENDDGHFHLISEVPPGNTSLPVLSSEIFVDDDGCVGVCSDVAKCDAVEPDVNVCCPVVCDVPECDRVYVEWDDTEDCYIDTDGNAYTVDVVENSCHIVIRPTRKAQSSRPSTVSMDYFLNRW